MHIKVFYSSREKKVSDDSQKEEHTTKVCFLVIMDDALRLTTLLVQKISFTGRPWQHSQADVSNFQMSVIYVLLDAGARTYWKILAK